MKVLLDEDMPYKLRTSLGTHDGSTVGYMGWKGLKNGRLIKTAEEAGFEVLLTGDQSLDYQQNPSGRRISVVVLTKQEWPDLKLVLDRIVAALDRAVPTSVEVVDCRFKR